MEMQSTCRLSAKWPFGLSVIAAACVMIALLGCSQSSGPKRHTVTGTVTFNGQPVPFGEIVFEPDSSAGNSGPQGVAEIVNGKYETSADRGVVGGPHTVLISGYPTNPANEDEENPSKPLFQGYKTTVDLPQGSSTQDFDVPENGKTPVEG